MSVSYVKKRDGKIVEFDLGKIANAIFMAAKSVGGSDKELASKLADKVVAVLDDKFKTGMPAIEDVQDCVEKVLIEEKHARTAKVYILYREKRSKIRAKLKVIKKKRGKSDTTDKNLLVETKSKDLIEEFDTLKIVQALEKEAELSPDLAKKIANRIEDKIINSGISYLSTSLIRELVTNEMFERGLNIKMEKQSVIGMPMYDLDELILSKNKENSNVVSNNPEAVNLAIAENVLKQYALKKIFSTEVSAAHMLGAMHLHDLGYPVRAYCSAHSLEYIKKYGLHLANLSTTSSPAGHAGTLTGHLNTFLASMQAYYAGALGIGYINLFYAPYTIGMSDQRLKQEMQYLIFSCSQNAFSRGGQTLFIDFNVHLGVPDYMKNIPAIGAKGKYMIKNPDGSIERVTEVPRDKKGNVEQPHTGRILTYGNFEKESQRVAEIMMGVWRDGDSEGKVFPFPKLDLHVTEKSFSDPRELELLKLACDISSENGSPYFVFDRDEVVLSACCRLRTKIEDNYMLTNPESMRFCGFQNVTINLPQCAYRAGKGDVEAVIREVNRIMELAAKAHLQKKEFIATLMVPGGPMWQVGMKAMDGRQYIELDNATYIIGIIGLNESVKFATGEELHESDDAYKTGIKIISGMYLKIKELESKYNLHFTLEETPGESTSLRFAKVDMRDFPESRDYVKGNIETGEVYYTNSIHFTPDAPIDIFERIDKQGKFNTLIESGCITHVFLGEQKPDPEAIFKLVKRTWDTTESAQLVISPEFTVCNDCHKVTRGFIQQNEEVDSKWEKQNVATAAQQTSME